MVENGRKIVRWASLVVIVLLPMSLVSTALEFPLNNLVAQLSGLDLEASVGTWFSSQLLLGTAGLLFLTSRLDKARTRPWSVLAVVFVALSAEEVAGFHEAVGGWIRDHVHEFTGFLYYSWIIPGLVFVTIFAIAFIPFLASLPNVVRIQMLLAGALYVGGAVGLEAISANFAFQQGETSLSYIIVAHLEDTAEQAGVILFANAVIGQLQLSLSPQSAKLLPDRR